MELERLKAAWQEQKFEGYLFEKPPSRITADVRRKAMEMKSRNLAEDVSHVLGSMLIVGMWIFWYDSRQPLMTRAGIILLMAGIALEAIAYIAPRFRYRGERFDLPRNEFLLREKKRIEARIRLVKGSLTWLSVPMLAGCILYAASVVKNMGELLSCVALLAFMWGIAFWVNARRVRKHLAPLLVEINWMLSEADSGLI